MLEMFFLIRSRAVPYQISRTTGLQLSWSDDYNTKFTIREPKMHHIIKKDAKIVFFTSREGILETRNQSSDHWIRIFRVYWKIINEILEWKTQDSPPSRLILLKTDRMILQLLSFYHYYFIVTTSGEGDSHLSLHNGDQAVAQLLNIWT